MLSHAPVSDECLMGYSIFVSMVAAALLLFLGLGVFVWNETPSQPPVKPEPRSLAGKKERPPYPTTISLFADGAMLVSTSPLDTKPFPREEVGLVFAEMLLRKGTPPLQICCDPGVPQSMAMDILVKARDAGLRDIRLGVPREWEKP